MYYDFLLFKRFAHSARPSHRRALGGSKMAPRGPKMAPRWSQDGPERLQDDPKRPQDGPKRAQDGPDRSQDASPLKVLTHLWTQSSGNKRFKRPSSPALSLPTFVSCLDIASKVQKCTILVDVDVVTFWGSQVSNLRGSGGPFGGPSGPQMGEDL